MKKLIIFVLSLLSLLLCACGRPEVVYVEEQQIVVENTELSPMTPEESMEMQRFMSAGRACIQGDQLYCFDFDENYSPVLAAYTLGPEGPGDFRILAEDCQPLYLTMFENRLYYVNKENSFHLESVKPDGSDRQELISAACDFFRISDGRLYYCGSDNILRSAKPDGTAQQSLMPYPCFYPYVLEDMVLCQNAEDEHLCIYRPESGSWEELIDTPAYAPVIAGERLWCSVPGGVLSTDLEGLEPLKYQISGMQGCAEFVFDGESVNVSGTLDAKGLKGWSFSGENPEESFAYAPEGGYRGLEFVSGDYTLYSVYQDDGRIRFFLLEDSQGGQWRFSGGKVL